MGFLEDYDDQRGSEPPQVAQEPAAAPGSWLDEYDAARPTSAVEALQQGTGAFGRGLAEIPAGLLDAAGIAASKVGARSMGGADIGKGLQGYAQAVRDVAAAAIPEVERLRDRWLLSQGPEALGSAVGFLIPGGWLKAAGVPAWASTMGLGSAVGGSAQYHDARLSGASEDDQWKAYLLGAGVGTTEAIPLSRILNRADKATKGGLRHALVDAVLEGGEEWLQEAGSQAASNAIASEVLKYDDDRALLEGVIQSGNGGGFAGVVLSALATASAHSVRRAKAAKDKKEVDEFATDVQTALAQPSGALQVNLRKAQEERGETKPAQPETAAPAPETTPAAVEPAEVKPETPPPAPAEEEPPALSTYEHTEAVAENFPITTPLEPTAPVAIADLRLTQLENFRSGVDEERVDALAEKMAAGEPLPPVTAIRTKEGLRLLDGHHRVLAAKKLGFKEVPVRIVAEPKDSGPSPVAPPAEVTGPAAPATAPAQPMAPELKGESPAPTRPTAPEHRRTADVVSAMRSLVKQIEADPEADDGFDLVTALDVADRVLAQREEQGSKGELEEALRDLVTAAKSPPADIGSRKADAQAAYALAAIKAAKAKLGALDAARTEVENERRASERKPQPPAKKPLLGLRLGPSMNLIEVASFEEASAAYQRLRDESGAGASTLPAATIIDFETGKPVARISYNGRVWSADDKTLLLEADGSKPKETPAQPTAPEPKGSTPTKPKKPRRRAQQNEVIAAEALRRALEQLEDGKEHWLPPQLQVAWAGGGARLVNVAELLLRDARVERTGLNTYRLRATEVGGKAAVAQSGLPRPTSNEALTTAKTATTEAVSRGAKVTVEAAREIADVLGEGTLRDALGDAGKAKLVLRALVQSGAFSKGDLTALVLPTSGLPTQAGKQAIEDALLGALVTDVRVLSEAPPAVRTTIMRALPPLVRIKAHVPGIAQTITNAVQGAAELRASKQPLADALRQQVLPGVDEGWKHDHLAVAILRALEGQSPTEVAKRFSRAAQGIEDSAAGQGNLFEAQLSAFHNLARAFDMSQLEEDGVVEEDGDIPDEPAGDSGVMLDPGDLPVEMQLGRPADPVTGGGARVDTPIGDRLRGQIQPAPGVSGRTSQPEIVRALSKVVEAIGGKTPIRWGRLGTKRARGIFKVGPEVIRVQKANNVSTAAHEVGHALEKHAFGWVEGSPWVKPTIGRKEQRELVALGRALYGTMKPSGGYKREGFAEFIRLYTMDPAKARADAPAFSNWFEADFLSARPKVREALLEVRRLADLWKAQGSRVRAEESMVDPASPTYRARRLWERASVDAVVEALLEVARPLNAAARRAEEALGRLLAPSEDPYTLATVLRSTHSGRMRHMIEDGMIDLAGNNVGPALNQITPLVKGRYEDFTLYMWARRSLSLLNPPVREDKPRRAPREPGLSQTDAEALMTELGSPEFERAAQYVYDWQDGVLNYAAQASPSFARVVAQIRDADVGNYVPLQREFDAMDEAWGREKMKRGLAASGGVAKRLRGSGRRVKNPFPVMIANAERTVLAAHRRMVLDSMMKLSTVEGLGDLIEEVPVDQVPAAETSVEEVIERIGKMVQQRSGWMSTGGPGPVGLTQGALEDEKAAYHDVLGETLTFFAPAQFPKGQDPVVPFWDGQRMRWFLLDHRVARTLAGMDVYRLPFVVDLVLGLPKRLLVMGTTGLRASFGLVTNPLIDLPTLWQNTRANASGARLLTEFLGQMAKAALTAATGGRVIDQHLAIYQRLGGEMANSLGADTQPTARAARRLFQGRAVRVVDPRNVFDFVRDLLQFPESAARATEFKLVARDIGWEPGTPLSLNQSLQLLQASKQATVDFTAHGWLSRVVNQVVPFFNVAFQAPRSSARAARRNPSRWAARGLQLSAISLILWWMVKDEPWYEELDAKAKGLFWKIPFRWNGRDELVLIPRRGEGGMLFGAAVEAFADSWYRQDPKGMREFMGTWWDASHPPILPVLVEEGIEQLSNRDLFWETKIVPMGELGLPPEEQANEYTTRAAHFLGALFGKVGAPEGMQSPRRIDHALRGVFGGAPYDVLDLLEPRPRAELADTPVFGRLFQRGGQLGFRPRSVELLYETAEGYDRAGLSMRRKPAGEDPAHRGVRLMLDDATRAISALSYVRSQTEDPDKRRAITVEMVDLARSALQDAEDGMAARAPMQQERRRAEAEADKAKGKR